MEQKRDTEGSKNAWRIAIVWGVLGVLPLPLMLAAFGAMTRIDVKVEPQRDKARTLAFSGDGKMIAVNGSHNLRIWEVSSGEILQDRYVGGERGPIVFSGGALKLIDNSGRLYALDLRANEETRVSPESAGTFNAFSPDGKLAASMKNGRVSLWNTETGKTLRELDVDMGLYEGVASAFSRSNSLFACAGISGRLHVWEVPTGRKLREFQDEEFRTSETYKIGLKSLVFSPDERCLAWVTDLGSVRLWNIADGKVLWSDSRDLASSVAFSSDGEFLATLTSEGKWYIWEVASGRQVAEDSTNPDHVAVLSPDFRIIASSENLETLFLHDVASNNEPRLLSHPSPFQFVQFARVAKLILFLSLPFLAGLTVVLPIVAIGVTVKAGRGSSRPQGRARRLKYTAAGLAIIGLVFCLLFVTSVVVFLYFIGKTFPRSF